MAEKAETVDVAGEFTDRHHLGKELETRIEDERQAALSDSRSATIVGAIAVMGSVLATISVAIPVTWKNFDQRWVTLLAAITPALAAALSQTFRWADWRDYHWDQCCRMEQLLLALQYERAELRDVAKALGELLVMTV